MSIFPLQQFEADLEEAEREAYERLKPPTSMVVRFGSMRLVGEYPYKGDQKPGCGSKIVVRTHRGVELSEMLTSTCPNAGCSKSVSRKEMLEYIENSGGRDFPFYSDGRVMRVATVEDMNKQAAHDAQKKEQIKTAREHVRELDLPMKVIDAEMLLGGERLIFYFLAEERIDFRTLARQLAEIYKTRIELLQVGARDEARLNADYERCGQHCCCKQFLKVLKPVSMKSAKTQKATLDPLKISGRCGRLMCCLRYEDETYDELRKRLPHRKSRVGTPEGPGMVISTQILTQLVLVALESDGTRIAVPVEELCDPDAPLPKKPKAPDPMRGLSDGDAEEKADGKKKRRSRRGRRGGKSKGKGDPQAKHREKSKSQPADEHGGDADGAQKPDTGASASGDGAAKKKKRRRRRGGRGRGKGKRGGGGPKDGDGGSGGDSGGGGD